MTVTVLNVARVNLLHRGCPLFYFEVGYSVRLLCVLLSFLYLMKGGVVLCCVVLCCVVQLFTTEGNACYTLIT